jgi:hypothetical protein
LLDVTSATAAETKTNFINTSTGGVGLELRSTNVTASQYIDFTVSSTNSAGDGTPDFTNRILSNNTYFKIPNITILNSNGSVGINNNTPDPSAILDIKSIDKGLLVPRMSTAQRLAIVNPAVGLMVYDTTTQSAWYYRNSTGWSNTLAISGWNMTGNAVDTKPIYRHHE